jgi:hypothetical protein
MEENEHPRAHPALNSNCCEILILQISKRCDGTKPRPVGLTEGHKPLAFFEMLVHENETVQFLPTVTQIVLRSSMMNQRESL